MRNSAVDENPECGSLSLLFILLSLLGPAEHWRESVAAAPKNERCLPLFLLGQTLFFSFLSSQLVVVQPQKKGQRSLVNQQHKAEPPPHSLSLVAFIVLFFFFFKSQRNEYQSHSE